MDDLLMLDYSQPVPNPFNYKYEIYVVIGSKTSPGNIHDLIFKKK